MNTITQIARRLRGNKPTDKQYRVLGNDNTLSDYLTQPEARKYIELYGGKLIHGESL